jgi:hypothetical protein
MQRNEHVKIEYILGGKNTVNTASQMEKQNAK